MVKQNWTIPLLGYLSGRRHPVFSPILYIILQNYSMFLCILCYTLIFQSLCLIPLPHIRVLFVQDLCPTAVVLLCLSNTSLSTYCCTSTGHSAQTYVQTLSIALHDVILLQPMHHIPTKLLTDVRDSVTRGGEDVEHRSNRRAAESCGAAVLKWYILQMKGGGFGEDTASMEHSKGMKRHSDMELLDIEWLEEGRRLESVGQGSIE